jgi:hypothetical protein
VKDEMREREGEMQKKSEKGENGEIRYSSTLPAQLDG